MWVACAAWPAPAFPEIKQHVTSFEGIKINSLSIQIHFGSFK
jgi:hypothetical protein